MNDKPTIYYAKGSNWTPENAFQRPPTIDLKSRPTDPRTLETIAAEEFGKNYNSRQWIETEIGSYEFDCMHHFQPHHPVSSYRQGETAVRRTLTLNLIATIRTENQEQRP